MLRTGVHDVSKKRRDAVALFTEGRDLTATVLRATSETGARAERLAAGLIDLWPAPWRPAC